MKRDQHILACARVADMPDPSTGSRLKHCKVCGFKVWVAFSSPYKGELIWCTHCALDEMKLQVELGEEIEVLPPTAKQLKDLARWKRRESS